MFSKLSPELQRDGEKVVQIIKRLQAADPAQPITVSFVNEGKELFIPARNNGTNNNGKKRKKRRRK